MTSITNIQSVQSGQKTPAEIQEEFQKFYAKHVPLNPYLTNEVIHKQIQKPVYVSLKNIEKVEFQLYANVFTYFAVIYWIFLYPQYEFWTIADGFPDYLISTEGRVWSKHSKKCLSWGNMEKMERENLYIRIGLILNKKHYDPKLHRLMIASFMPEGHNHPKIVNHKDGHRRNPVLLNCEPSDDEHNPHHAREVLGKGTGVEICRTPVNSVDNSDKIYYNSITKAASDNGTDRDTLALYINQKVPFNLKGIFYMFTRDEPLRTRQILNITREEFFLYFKEIGLVTFYNNEKTELKTIDGKGYYISRKDGMIVTYNESTGQFEILQVADDKGYLRASLYFKGTYYPTRVNRLVLIAHDETTTTLDYWNFVADHIDQNKMNNAQSNLRWVTLSDNRNNTQIHKPIKMTFAGMSTVLPSGESLTDHITSGRSNVSDMARAGTLFLGNSIEYITTEQYNLEKSKNDTLFMFKQKPYTIWKLQEGVLTGKFDSLDDAAASAGLTGASSFSRELAKYEWAPYSIEHNGRQFETILKYKTLVYRGCTWFVLQGTITIFDKTKLQEICK